MKNIIITIILCITWGAIAAATNDNRKIGIHVPPLDSIRTESTNEKSRFYYPRLREKFMKNDTTMTNEEYRYFYYGTLFQEDYDPYRPACNIEQLEEVQPLYYKEEHTADEREAILDYALMALDDNPVDLVQLKNLVYVYEKKRKDNLAKIWKSKLNHLLYVIASSGGGHSVDSPWIVVYPRHEFDFFNIYGQPVVSQEYLLPHYDHINVGRDGNEDYYFDLGPLLEQYYLKHPSELED